MALLADLFVQFSSHGAAGLKSDIDGLSAAFSPLVAVAKAAGTAVLGFASAGLAMSAQGAMIANLIERLSLGLAGAFKPVIDLVIQGLQFLTDTMQTWGQTMTDVIGGAVGMVKELWSAISPLLNGLWEAFQKVTEAFKPLWDQTVRVFSGMFNLIMKVISLISGTLGSVLVKLAETVASILTPVIKAVEKLLWLMEQAMKFLGISTSKPGGDTEGFAPLGKGGGQSEGIAATYQRIQQAALKTGDEVNYPKETAANTKALIDASAAALVESQAQRDVLQQIRDKKGVGA